MACDVILRERDLIRTDSAVSLHVDLEPTPSAAPEARRFIQSAMDGVAARGVLDNVQLLASELVTNVIGHARSRVHLGVTYDIDNVLVTVQDESPAGPAERASNADADQIEESGRGMTIIATLADDFGWQRLPANTGKVMWFVVAMSEPVNA